MTRAVTSGSSPASRRRASGWRSTASTSVNTRVPRQSSVSRSSRMCDHALDDDGGGVVVDRGEEERFLVGEVGVRHGAADAGVAGDVGHRRGTVTRRARSGRWPRRGRRGGSARPWTAHRGWSSTSAEILAFEGLSESLNSSTLTGARPHRRVRSPPMPQTSAPDRKVPTRRISFEESLAATCPSTSPPTATSSSATSPRPSRRCSPTARTSSSARCGTTATASPIPTSSARSPGSSGRRRPTAASTGRSTTGSTELGYPTKFFERLTRRASGCASGWRRPSPTSPPPRRSSTSPPRSPSSCCRATTPERCSGTTRSATCSCGTRSRRPSTRRSPSTSTRRWAAASGCGCGR